MPLKVTRQPLEDVERGVDELLKQDIVAVLFVVSLAFVLVLVSLLTPSLQDIPPTEAPTLRWKSGFESPIAITYDKSRRHAHLHGADQGYDWDKLGHVINFGTTDAYPDHADAQLDYRFTDPFGPPDAHTGSRALCLMQLNDYSTSGAEYTKSALTVSMHDGQGGPEEISNMRKYYRSVWIYIPTDFDLGDEYGYISMGTFGRDTVDGIHDFSVAWEIRKSSSTGELCWWCWARRHGEKQYWDVINYDVVVPLGQWWRMEAYFERHLTNGTLRLWCNGVNVFDITGKKTCWYADDRRFYIKPCSVNSRQTFGGADAEDYPLNLWFDDLEIWDGLPST